MWLVTSKSIRLLWPPIVINFVIIDLSTFSNIESVQYPHIDNYNMDPLT